MSKVGEVATDFCCDKVYRTAVLNSYTRLVLRVSSALHRLHATTIALRVEQPRDGNAARCRGNTMNRDRNARPIHSYTGRLLAEL